jgi:hypothetical protein
MLKIYIIIFMIFNLSMASGPKKIEQGTQTIRQEYIEMIELLEVLENYDLLLNLEIIENLDILLDEKE